MTARVRFGILGSGYMGRTYAFGLANINKAGRLVAVAGGSRAGDVAADYGGEAEQTVEALIARPDVDAVVIATPHTTHLPYALAAAAAGKHVYLEKPMALTVAECDAIIDACTSAGVKLTVNKITRHRGAGKTARRLLDAGAIGDIRLIRGTYLIHGYDTPDKPWIMQPEEGSPWLDWGAHGCDIVRWLGGSEATAVFASFATFTPNPPANQTGSVQFELASGALAQLWMSYEIPVDGIQQLGRYLIIGSKGVLDFDAYGDVRIDRGDGGGWVTEWETPPFQYLTDPFTVNRVQGFADQLEDFAEAIRDDREPSVPANEARMAIAMVEAAERSGASGEVVRL
jgi:predicted dehydrogenase